MRQDFETADQILPNIEEEYRTRVAQFLEKQGFKEQAMAGTNFNLHVFPRCVAVGTMCSHAVFISCDRELVKWDYLYF